MNCTLLRAATGARGEKFEWTEEMEYEYQNVRKIMKKHLKLSPYDPKQKLRLESTVPGRRVPDSY